MNITELINIASSASIAEEFIRFNKEA